MTMRLDGTTSAQTERSLGAPTTQATQTDMGPDAFMRLLVTQIRNQDPMEPMDTRDMMTQLTQLTEVERLVSIDSRMQSLEIASTAIANTQAVDLVGTTVEADSSHIVLDDLGSAHGAFELEGAAATVEVTVRDVAGNVVRTLQLGAKGGGACEFDWDGADDSGIRAPAGRYTISVEARDAEGAEVQAHLRVRGRVGAVRYEDGYPTLSIGGADVMMGDVRSIEPEEDEPPPAVPTPGA